MLHILNLSGKGYWRSSTALYSFILNHSTTFSEPSGAVRGHLRPHTHLPQSTVPCIHTSLALSSCPMYMHTSHDHYVGCKMTNLHPRSQIAFLVLNFLIWIYAMYWILLYYLNIYNVLIKCVWRAPCCHFAHGPHISMDWPCMHLAMHAWLV
jgi:hypothetical protein